MDGARSELKSSPPTDASLLSLIKDKWSIYTK